MRSLAHGGGASVRNPGRHLPVSPSYTTGRAPEPALRKEQNLRAGAGREDLRGLWPSVERGVPVVAERGVPAYRRTGSLPHLWVRNASDARVRFAQPARPLVPTRTDGTRAACAERGDLPEGQSRKLHAWVGGARWTLRPRSVRLWVPRAAGLHLA